MAEAAQAPEPAAAPAKKGGALGAVASAVGTFLLALAAVVVGGFINAALHPVQELAVGPDGQLTLKPEEKHEGKEAKGAPPASGPALYFALDPPLVVNFEQSGAVRFLQVTVEVLARDPEVIAAVQQNAPLIRNNLMLLMSNLDYAEIMTREGKEKLRAAALAEVRSILKRETGKTGPESLLFTSFVVQ
jgi:flagellar FliL protein